MECAETVGGTLTDGQNLASEPGDGFRIIDGALDRARRHEVLRPIEVQEWIDLEFRRRNWSNYEGLAPVFVRY
jgi:hypothetical protein